MAIRKGTTINYYVKLIKYINTQLLIVKYEKYKAFYLFNRHLQLTLNFILDSKHSENFIDFTIILFFFSSLFRVEGLVFLIFFSRLSLNNMISQKISN